MTTSTYLPTYLPEDATGVRVKTHRGSLSELLSTTYFVYVRALGTARDPLRSRVFSVPLGVADTSKDRSHDRSSPLGKTFLFPGFTKQVLRIKHLHGTVQISIHQLWKTDEGRVVMNTTYHIYFSFETHRWPLCCMLTETFLYVCLSASVFTISVRACELDLAS